MPVKEQPIPFYSVYGELSDRNTTGLIEQIVHPPEGGTFVKLYGCKFYFKGTSNETIVQWIGLGKGMLSFVPREIIAKSPEYVLAMIWKIVFRRRSFINDLDKWFTLIRRHAIIPIQMPYEYFNSVAAELARSMSMALHVEFPEIVPDTDLAAIEPGESYGKKNYRLQMAALIAKIIHFTAYFIEYDAAYRFPLQDVLENVDKEHAERAPIAEVRRLMGLLISREGHASQIRKWKYVRLGVTIFLYASPTARRIARLFLLHLDVERVKLDEHDWYFCLWRYYNYRGMSLEDRIKERERIDKAFGNYYPVLEVVHKGTPESAGTPEATPQS